MLRTVQWHRAVQDVDRQYPGNGNCQRGKWVAQLDNRSLNAKWAWKGRKQFGDVQKCRFLFAHLKKMQVVWDVLQTKAHKKTKESWRANWANMEQNNKTEKLQRLRKAEYSWSSWSIPEHQWIPRTRSGTKLKGPVARLLRTIPFKIFQKQHDGFLGKWFRERFLQHTPYIITA